MGRLALGTLVLASTFLSSCGSLVDEESTLPAPTNLSVSYLQSATSWHYTFGLTAVASAESYLIYYSVSADNSTAVSLASGPAPPISWSYSKANAYNGQTVYFWVRAYDGKNYGKWSTPVTGLLN
jgi:hypothetical protein